MEGLPEALRQEVPDAKSLPSGRYVPAAAWEAEGKEAAHQTGKVVADADASGGHAWEARSGADNPALPMLYGPYLPMPSGDYVAFFRLKLLEEAGEEAVADMDAATANGQDIRRVRELRGSDLALNRYVEAPLAFHHPGGKLECRVYWKGYATLRVDRVTLFRLEGASLDLRAERAPQPVPSGLPKDLTYRYEPRPFPEIFPRSAAPAERLLVIDLRRQLPDWQLLLLSLQGLVNRAQPQIYSLFNATDADWLAWMQRRKWVRDAETVSHPETLIARFRNRWKGVIITDPMLPASKNVATMLAGVEDGLVVSPRLAKKLALPVLDDLRGRWHTNVDAYQWAFDHLWSRLNHHVLACAYPDHLGLRDYLVEQKVFIFWLSGPIDGARKYADPQAEVRLMETLLAHMPANIPVMSYPWAGKDVGIGEGPGVTLFAEFGKYLVGSIDASNLSVHSGIRPGPFHQRTPPPPPLRNDKIYVSWVISDGDNLPVLATNNFPQFWKDPVRGHIPLGWTLSPSAATLIPDIVDYYYTTATPNDAFLGAVSGVGYTYPDSYADRFRPPDRQHIFDGFLGQTHTTMDQMDLKSLWIMNATRPEVIGRYAERIPDLQALFPDYGRRVADYAEATYPTVHNVPVFHALTNWAEATPRAQQIDSLVAQIRAATPLERPAFLHLFVLNWFADLPMLQEILHRLGPDYVAVRPDHLAALYRREMARQQVLTRMPATLVGIQGQPVSFTARVQNVSSRPLDLHAQVVAGLSQPTLTPAVSHLAPGQAVSVQVSGAPTGDRVQWTLTGPFGSRRNTLALQQVPANEILGTLPAGATLRFVRRLEAVTLPHHSGKEARDPQSAAPMVWTARPGEAEPGYVVFGPYLPLPPGRYLALYRLKRTGEGRGSAATVDVCVGGGQNVTGTRQLSTADLPRDQYRSVPLVFDHPGGDLETRVLWPGNTPLAIDTITLWEIH